MRPRALARLWPLLRLKQRLGPGAGPHTDRRGGGQAGAGCVSPSLANLSQSSSSSRERGLNTAGRRHSVQGGAAVPCKAGLSSFDPGPGPALGSTPGAVCPLGRKLRESAARDAGVRDGGRHGPFLS